MSVLFAATHPERVTALVLYGAMGRTTEAPDYPWASPAEALRESAAEFIAPYWGQHAEGMVELFAPSFADDPEAAEFTARLERSAASPAMVQQIFEMFLDIDVRAVLPTIHVPTLVLHRHGDRVVNRRAGEELAARIPDARYVELPGIDHVPWAGDSEAVLGEIEEFLTGARSVAEPDRVLATVMFTDIVGSTERAAELGDARWRELLAAHQAAVRRELTRFRGREVKTLGDGYLATFDGPARAIRCGHAIAEAARSDWPGGAHRASLRRGRADRRRRRRDRGPHRGARRSPRRRRARCSSPARSRTSSPDRGSSSWTAARSSSRESPTNGGCSRQPRNGQIRGHDRRRRWARSARVQPRSRDLPEDRALGRGHQARHRQVLPRGRGRHHARARAAADDARALAEGRAPGHRALDAREGRRRRLLSEAHPTRRSGLRADRADPVPVGPPRG